MGLAAVTLTEPAPLPSYGGLAGMAPVLDLVEPRPRSTPSRWWPRSGRHLGAEQVSFLIADLGGDSLVRFVRPVPGRREPVATARLETVAMAGTPYQRALVSQQVQVVADGGRYRLFAPVTDRGDALGVLELVLGSPARRRPVARSPRLPTPSPTW